MSIIPPITDPLGRSWKQPNPERILLDATHAVMDRTTYDALLTYSTSVPSGVYPGKMWKAVFSDGTADLRWFGIVPGRPDVCSNNHRAILVVEAVSP